MATPAPLPSPGPSDVWGEDLNDAVDSRYNLSVHEVEVGPGMWVDSSDPTKPKIYRTDLGPVTQSRFRGEWVPVNQNLIYSQDFSTLSSPPSEFGYSYSDSDFGVNTWSIAGMGVAIGTNKPAYSNVLRFHTNTADYTSYVRLTWSKSLTSIPPTTSITRIKLHTAIQENGGDTGFTWSRYFYADSSPKVPFGTDASLGTLYDWSIWDVTTEVLDTFWVGTTFSSTSGSASARIYIQITGVEVYGVDEDKHYLTGDTVTYDGTLYQALQDHPLGRPDLTDGTQWSSIPFSFEPSGPYQTYIDTRITAIGSRVDDPADALWGGSNAYDVEFTDDDFSGTLPSGWAWVNQGSSTYSQQFGKAIVLGDSSTSTLNCVVRDIPTETTWTATAKISQTSGPVNWNRVGLVLQSSSSNKTTYFGLTQGTSSPWSSRVVTISDWTNPTTFSGGEITSIELKSARYLRIKKNSSTYDFQYSVDGISWMTLSSGRSAFDTYDKIGLATSRDASGGAGVFDWFRVR